MTETVKKLLIAAIVLLIFGEVWLFPAFSATEPRDAYFEAEACNRSLRQNPQKIKYRHNWLRCIKKYQSVYHQDPDGPWAAAGLYRSAKMYQDLAKYSGWKSDKKEAIDIFQQVVDDFPQSRYREKAAREIRNMGATVAVSQTAPAEPASPVTEATPKDLYIQAERCYSDLRKNAAKTKYRDSWLRCIEKFQLVYERDPQGPWAPAGLFMAATLYQKLYAYSFAPDDLETARKTFNQLVNEFPDSRYRDKAVSEIQAMPGSVEKTPVADSDSITEKIQNYEAREEPAGNAQSPSTQANPGGLVTVTNLRFWSNPNYTRVVIDADQEASYNHHLLKKDPSIGKPQRLYVDLSQSRLHEDIRRSIPIHDDLLSDARAGQYTPDSVRVVVDIKSFKTYKIFSLKDPFRIVIDVWGTRTAKSHGDEEDLPLPSDTIKKNGRIPPGSLAKQLALGVRRVVIDPGHGGRDYGAPGYLKGVHEKHVVLQIANRLAKKIKSVLGLEVILTRSGDRFLTLEERTALANTQNADLFISIHTNASRDRRAYGIETYFLNLATDDEAIRVAAMENATSTKNISDLQKILYDLMQNAKINESSRLAAHVQTALISHLKNKRYTRVKSKGVKQAPFYVLLGAQMPSILIETAFISNSRECKRLVDPRYQERLAEGVVEGIRSYVKATTPTALLNIPQQSRPQG